MISIRDADKSHLEEIAKYLSEPPSRRATVASFSRVTMVLNHINELMQQAPVIEPRIAPMSEADKRICYPERFK